VRIGSIGLDFIHHPSYRIKIGPGQKNTGLMFGSIHIILPKRIRNIRTVTQKQQQTHGRAFSRNPGNAESFYTEEA